MTEQPDTTEIRAMVQYLPHVSVDRYLEALDALDAARADIANWRREADEADAAYIEIRLRAEAAEARIANALSLVDADSPNGWGLVVRALTEGTGQ